MTWWIIIVGVPVAFVLVAALAVAFEAIADLNDDPRPGKPY